MKRQTSLVRPPLSVEYQIPNSGYSATLNLILRWEQGQLGWYDPATEQHIATFDSEHEARIAAEAHAENERARADTERARADSEHAARVAAEARIRELEARLYNTDL